MPVINFATQYKGSNFAIVVNNTMPSAVSHITLLQLTLPPPDFALISLIAGLTAFFDLL